MPIYLAIDTTMNDCSVALLTDDAVVTQAAEQARNHANELLPLIDAVLTKAEVARDQLDGLIVVNGPGSFTGVRIGVSVAQGMALALSIPVMPVSSILVTAHRAWRIHQAERSLVMLDARLNEVYTGAYQFGQDKPQAVIEEQVISPSLITAPEGDWLLVGNGCEEYAEQLPAGIAAMPFVPGCMPHAEDAAYLGRAMFEQGLAIEATDLEPVYLRNKVADVPASKAVW